MINVFLIEGTIVEKQEMATDENGVKFVNVKVACARNYRNEDGVYEDDIFVVKTMRGLAEIISLECNEGNFISFQGRIESNNGQYFFIAEKGSFLK